MLAINLLDKSVFIRELLPQDLKLEIETLSRAEALEVAELLAHVVCRAHARQIGAGDRRYWLATLPHNRLKTLDAPSRRWCNVVDLVAADEPAYLDHCRHSAMEAAA